MTRVRHLPMATALVGALSTSRISWPLEAYHAALAALPQSLHEALEAQMGGAPEEDPDCRDGAFHFPGA